MQIGGGYRVKIQNRISMREPLLELMIEPIKHRDTETNMALIPCKLTWNQLGFGEVGLSVSIERFVRVYLLVWLQQNRRGKLTVIVKEGTKSLLLSYPLLRLFLERILLIHPFLLYTILHRSFPFCTSATFITFNSVENKCGKLLLLKFNHNN